MKLQNYWMMLDIKPLLRVKPLFFIAITYSIAIVFLFFIPSSDIPKVKIKIEGLDKIVHCTIHFFLITVWMLYFYVKNNFQFRTKWLIPVFLSVLLFGIIVEIIQGVFTNSRGADIFDVAANLVGSLLGILFFKMIKNNLKLKNLN